MLRDPAVDLGAVMNVLRSVTKVQNQRMPSLPSARLASRLDRLHQLRRWLTIDGRYVPGLTFHQAKGREWDNVDVALEASARTTLAAGLDGSKEADRKLYVALTRGAQTTRLRSI